MPYCKCCRARAANFSREIPTIRRGKIHSKFARDELASRLRSTPTEQTNPLTQFFLIRADYAKGSSRTQMTHIPRRLISPAPILTFARRQEARAGRDKNVGHAKAWGNHFAGSRVRLPVAAVRRQKNAAPRGTDGAQRNPRAAEELGGGCDSIGAGDRPCVDA